MKTKTILIATGGTGGHIYPGIALADALKKQGYEVVFIGNQSKMEATIVPQAGYPFYGIHNQGLVGNPIQKMIRVISQVLPTISSMKLLKKIKPDQVVVFGGYVSIPVGVAAWLRRIPLILHEQNAMAGVANKVLAPFAKGIAVCYPSTLNQFNNKNIQLIGNPRGALFVNHTDKEAFLTNYSFSADKPVVLVVMGSQGSETINETLKTLLPKVENEPFQLIVVTGKKHYETFVDGLMIPNNCVVVEHIDQLRVLSYVDLIVARAGATTVSEVIAAKVPAIFVPSPYVANNHQLKNVEALLQSEACLLLEEKDFTADSLLTLMNNVLFDTSLQARLKLNMEALSTPHATDHLIKMIES